ncbi:putative F-box/FBD/LRR-repeat protein At4g03220 [Cornus florida]|uniref:putative F-box/FBD/LRR-repeat protein At4g03220 n=1 Tax=Cornus florida TaxID=4283 RepID=UPI0028985821|nr:putative F-box/FBD/LRR-repeat protein At4g03220 [Cornus florida]
MEEELSRLWRESFDRFSNIPDGLFHEILCFLPIKDIARTSLVSKRFRQLCLSVPDLFLAFELQDLCKLGNWTDRFLTLRNGAKLRRFVLTSSTSPCEIAETQRLDNSRVGNWIHNTTVICKAQELDLSFGISKDKECFSLPLSTFIRTIKLNLYNGNLKLPSFSFNLLQVLDIKYARLARSLSEDWVSSLFPAIKKLNLVSVKGIDNLNITSSSLEYLDITGCYGLHRVVVSAERLQTLGVIFSHRDWLLRIFAPRLREVKLCDDRYCFQGSSMCLQSVNIDAPMLVESKSLLLLLQFMNHAKTVTLLAGFLNEVLFRRGSLWYMLVNVQNLVVQSFSKKDNKMLALASLFGMFPNLKTLTMSCFDLYPFGYELSNLLALDQRKFDIQYWESHDFAFLHQLEEANIEINKWAFEVGLIKYLIQHAKALHKMTVTFACNIDISRSSQIRDKLSEFYENFPNSTLDFVLK